jgi:hypothetical protein
MSAPSPDGKTPKITGFDHLHLAADFFYLPEHFVPDHQVFVSRRSIGSPTGCFLPVGSADPYAQNPQLDFLRSTQLGFRPVNNIDLRGSWSYGDCFHDGFVSLPDQ